MIALLEDSGTNLQSIIVLAIMLAFAFDTVAGRLNRHHSTLLAHLRSRRAWRRSAHRGRAAPFRST